MKPTFSQDRIEHSGVLVTLKVTGSDSCYDHINEYYYHQEQYLEPKTIIINNTQK